MTILLPSMIGIRSTLHRLAESNKPPEPRAKVRSSV